MGCLELLPFRDVGNLIATACVMLVLASPKPRKQRVGIREAVGVGQIFPNLISGLLRT